MSVCHSSFKVVNFIIYLHTYSTYTTPLLHYLDISIHNGPRNLRTAMEAWRGSIGGLVQDVGQLKHSRGVENEV